MELYGHHLCPDFPPIPPNDNDDRGGSSPVSRNESVVIIGAGIAGLSAATALGLMGFANVTVLEASGGVGGRLKSTSFVEKDGGPPLDVGAEWIHSVRGDRVLRSIVNFRREGDSGGDAVHDGVVVPDLIEYKPAISVNKHRSRILTWMYKETKFKSTTWHHWLLSNFQPVITGCVELNSPVVDIDYAAAAAARQDPNGAAASVVLTLEDGTTRAADRVICTAPLQVLKEDLIKFNPPLPARTKDAFRQIEMPPGFRILFRVSTKFYRDVVYVGSLCGGGGEWDDLTAIYDPLWGKDLQNSGDGSDLHVIAYVAIGHRNAGEMSELSDEDLAKEALARIDEIYDGRGSEHLVGEPVVQNWRAEPWVRGAYTFPGGDRSQLQKPIGDDGNGGGLVYFAGEHTSPKHSSLVPGAACEGRRAALEVARSLGVDIEA